MMGPLLIVDKSFLQMLNPDEIFQLSLHFWMVGTPTIIREIIADLKKPPGARLLPEDVVKLLATKMSTVHGVQPANFRKLAIANIFGAAVPMIGQVPVDSDAPNVHNVDNGVIYDSVPEQNMWRRWTEGNFTADDADVAAAWRDSLQKMDLRAVGDNWKGFVQDRFAGTQNLAELIVAVEQFLSDPKPDIQLELLTILLSLLRVPRKVRIWRSNHCSTAGPSA